MQRTRGLWRSATRRQAWPALLAGLVLLLQGLIPGAAVLGAHRDTPVPIELCSHAGLKRIAAPGRPADPHRGFGGLACEQCVMASFAAVATTPPLAPLPSSTVVVPRVQACASPALGPRAPPRPPSTAPPALS